jgi:hypothetical protein
MTQDMESKVYFCPANTIEEHPTIVFERTTHTFTFMKPVIFFLGFSLFGISVFPDFFTLTERVPTPDSQKMVKIFKTLDISSEQLAKDINVSPDLITAIQNDQAPLSQDVEHKLLDRYGIVIRD